MTRKTEGPSSRPKVLQIFNRYLEYGGEEGSVFRIGDTLQEISDVEYFTSSSREFLGSNLFEKVKMPFAALHNVELCRKLDRYQAVGQFNVWQIHNIFPTMSPSVYALAFKKGIPIIQYLHNYRMSCANGYFLNHGRTCTSCIHGNFIMAPLTGCWHDSRAISGMMAVILTRLRQLDVFKRISAWIALSKNQRTLHVEMGVPEDRIHVVPHFYQVDNSKLQETVGQDVLFIGRLSKEKGVHQLLDAWKLVRSTQAKLLIVGDGPEREALENRTRTERIANVEFVGFVKKDAQRAIWSRAAFSIVPSIWQDPLPTVVFEAWERGRAVIAANAGGLSDSVEHEVNGLLYEMFDHHQLAGHIDCLLGNSKKCIEFSENGMNKLKNYYSRARWIEKLAEIYQKVTEEQLTQ